MLNCAIVRVIRCRWFIVWNNSSACVIAQMRAMGHCVEKIIGVRHRADARKVDVHKETWCPYHSLLFTILSKLRMHAQSIRVVCPEALCQNVTSMFVQVNGNSRYFLFDC